VQRSKAVLRDGAPEVVQAVKQGELSVHAAQQLVALPKDTQVEIMAAASVEGASPTVVNRKVAAAMKGVAGRKTGPSPEDGAKGGGKPDIFGDVPELRSAADHLRAADEALSILLRGWEYASGDDVAVLMPIIRAIQRTIAPLAQQIADVTPAKVCAKCVGKGCVACKRAGWLPQSRKPLTSVRAAKKVTRARRHTGTARPRPKARVARSLAKAPTKAALSTRAGRKVITNKKSASASRTGRHSK
jgi:hypothetical protein